MVVVVLIFADFVLCCRAGGDCAIGSWRGPKNPFGLPINRLCEGELLGFEGELVAVEGEPVALEGGGTANTA